MKVVLTGQGADEPFCGYHRYLGERYGGAYRRLPTGIREGFLRPLMRTLPLNERLQRAVAYLNSDDVVSRFVDVYAVFDRESRMKLWRASERPPALDRLAPDVVQYWRDGSESLDPLVQMSFIDARLSLPDDFLLYGDKMSMAASVEARVPFLDLDLMAAAEALPSSFRIRRWQRKYIYRKVVAKWLPPDILARPKRGFDAPTHRWFRGDLAAFLQRTLLSATAACPVYFNPDEVTTLLRDHIAGRRDNRRRLYNLLVFELWHRQVIGGETPLDVRSPPAAGPRVQVKVDGERHRSRGADSRSGASPISADQKSPPACSGVTPLGGLDVRTVRPPRQRTRAGASLRASPF